MKETMLGDSYWHNVQGGLGTVNNKCCKKCLWLQLIVHKYLELTNGEDSSALESYISKGC